MYGQNFSGLKGVIYARYSSVNQREASIEEQIQRCGKLIEDHGGALQDVEVLADSAVSGTTTYRPAFERLVSLVKERRIDFIVTEDMSRISRDLADSAAFFKLLEHHRVPLIGVTDGVDTSTPGAKMLFAMRSLMNEQYIEQLRDKTSRGLAGRFKAGHSTGGLALGYRSEPVVDASGKILGYRVLVDEAASLIVQRIFEMYRSGLSFPAIAKALNREGVPTPRRGMSRKRGWIPETIRAILHNRSYVGEFTYRRREWRRAPGAKERRPVDRPRDQILVRVFPERRIVDEQTWDDVQARLAAVRACYTKSADGSPKGRVQTGRQNAYLLSGLLRCGACGSQMIIAAGTSARYYRCAGEKKRGICGNSLSLREDVARERVVSLVLERLTSPAALVRLRQRVAERLGELSRAAKVELRERRERLARTEQKIAGLIDFISEGERSDYVLKSLADLEAMARVEKQAIADLLERAAAPVDLPPPAFFVERAARLGELFERDPLRGREVLQKLFVDGVVRLVPQLSGHYVAEGRYTPLAVLSLPLGPETTKAPTLRGFQPNLWSRVSCAGRI